MNRHVTKGIRPFLLFLLILCAAGAAAQKAQKIMYGGVYNALTGEVLIGCKVELMDRNYVTLDSMRVRPNTNILNKWSPWRFHLEGRKPQPYIVRFSMEGFETVDLPVDSFTFKPREMIRFIKDVNMEKEMKKRELGEVTVKATLVKFYAKGDTLVFNADAFQLADGSMLDALIEQLPGVELKDDGQIFVNGRKVESLLLNGEDFFRSDRTVMLENLPAYAVKDIKVYDKESDFTKFTGVKDGQEELVMDVNLKRSYSIGWMANAEGAYGTEDRYLGRVFALRLTPNTRLSVFANLNNMNENRKPGSNGDWTPSNIIGGQEANKTGGLDYLINGEDARYKLTGSVSFRHFDTDKRWLTTSVNFLPDGNTYGRDMHNQFFCQSHFNTSHKLEFNWEDQSYITIQPSFSYSKWDDRNYYLSAAFNDDPSLYLPNILDSIASPEAGSIMRRIALNRTKTDQNNKGDLLSGSLAANSLIKTGIASDFLELFANVSYSNKTQKWYEHYRLDYPASTGATDFRNKYTDNDGPMHKKEYNAGADYYLVFPCNLVLIPAYHFHVENTDERYALFRLDGLDGWGDEDTPGLGMLPSEAEYLSTLDRPNSYWSYFTYTRNTVRMRIVWNGSVRKGANWNVEATLPLGHHYDNLHYIRENTDTVMKRKLLLFEPEIRIRGNWKGKQRGIDFRYKSISWGDPLARYLDIRTTTDPLNITLGNPNLKTTHQHQASLYYWLNHNEKQRYFNTYWSYTVTRNATAQGYIYNKETGVRTYRPEDVNGNYNIGFNTNYSMPLTKDKRLTFHTSTWSRLYNSVDLIGTDDGQAPVRSTVQTVNSGERIKLDYAFAKVKIGAKVSCGWNYLTSRRKDFTDINTLDLTYGVNGQAQLPWGLQFSTDINLYSRRGYEDRTMNTDDIVWNAQLSKRLLKDKLTVSLDGFDMLGQLSDITQTMNGQGRTETWRNVIPSYFMLRCIYRLNIQPANRR